MPQCSECSHYEEIDETKGDCFGHEVAADRDSEECPTQAFEPRESD